MSGSNDLVHLDGPVMDQSGLAWKELYSRHYPSPWLKVDREYHDSKQSWLSTGWRNPNLGSRELQAGDTVSHRIVTGPRRPELPNRKGKNSLMEASEPET